MRHPLTLAVTLALSAPAFAQQAGTVQDITVTGTTDLLANFVRASLNVQPGAALSSVNLRQVEQDVVATGYFKSAVAELRTVSGRDVLNIAVVPNPTISAVEATGLTFLPGDQFRSSIGELLNIAPGATLNTQRVDQAKEALAENYRQQGFPFVPSISSEVKTNTDGTVTVNFVVDETAPISRIEVEGNTLLPAATISAIFKPLYDARKFTSQTFFAAADALEQAYTAAGYVQSGLNPQGISLQNGVLKISVLESRVSAIDLSPLGADVATTGLQTQTGQPLTLAKLQSDVRTLANRTGKPVGFALQPNPQNPAQVTVLFGSAGVESGPVKSIAFSGNTRVPTATLAAAVKTKVGDVYSPQLAQDDFLALRDAYRKAGYEISTRDAITFENGVLTFNLREVRLVGYELQWQGDHRTQDRVILRELPTAGGIFNLTETQDALGRISRLGYVTVTGVNARSDAQTPENITYVIQLSESGARGIPLSLSAAYDSLTGLSGELGYQFPNAFGLGHTAGFTVTALRNDAGQNLAGNVNYTIPWLDLNFGDFRTNRTSLTVGAGTSVGGNQAILDSTNTDTGRDYTVRTTGFSLNLGRNITPNLSAAIGTSFNYKTYYLENLRDGETSTTTDAAATALLPQNNRTTRFEGSLGYDNTDSPEFPGRGVRASGLVAYNFGAAGSNPLSWTDTEVGVSGYYGFGRKVPRSFGTETYSDALAARVNAGTSFGSFPSGTGYYIGGSNPLASRELRGLNDGQLFGTNYLTSSVEYRHDFGLSGSVAQGIYGVVFADYGTAWSSGSAMSSAYGVGAGVQLNLGIGGTKLPSLRFDYGFSPSNTEATRGKFHFRIGNFW